MKAITTLFLFGQDEVAHHEEHHIETDESGEITGNWLIPVDMTRGNVLHSQHRNDLFDGRCPMP